MKTAFIVNLSKLLISNFGVKMKKAFLLISLSLVLFFCGFKSETSAKVSTFIMADSAMAAKVVTSNDEYTKYLSAYDLSIAKTNNTDTLTFLKHLAKNVKSWTDEEKQRFKSFSQNAEPLLSALKVNLPDKIILIKTTSFEYGGITAAYTRQNAIMITEKFLAAGDSMLYEVFLHEIFHVYSRKNPEKRRALYNIIGFYEAGDVSLPQDLYDRRISNPDAPALNTYIDLSIDSVTATYTPISYARESKYDPSKPGGIFQSFAFGLLKVQGNANLYVPVYEKGIPVFINPGKVDAFWKKIGRNTTYIIHPEEIMASNFVYLIVDRQNLPNPEIIEAMRKVISE
jgi:hypothetical protein